MVLEKKFIGVTTFICKFTCIMFYKQLYFTNKVAKSLSKVRCQNIVQLKKSISQKMRVIMIFLYGLDDSFKNILGVVNTSSKLVVFSRAYRHK